MVSCLYKNCLSKADEAAIAQAVAGVEKTIKAEIITVHMKKSDHYHSFKIVYGLVTGTFAALLTYYHGLTADMAALFTIQLAITAVLTLVPISSWLIPKHILREKAAEAAFKEYYVIDKNTPADLPFVLIFISTFERYAHILVSDSISKKYPDKIWEDVIAKFTGNVKAKGLRDSIIDIIKHIEKILQANFRNKT